MTKTFERTITVRVTYSDDPKYGETRYDEIERYSDDYIVNQEKNQRLSDWFGNTEYEVVADEMTPYIPTQREKSYT